MGGRLFKGASREFVRNLIWMLVVFGPLAAILILAAHLPLLEAAVLVVFSVALMVSILTVLALWSGAHDEELLSSHHHPGAPPEGRGLGSWHGGGDGGADGGGW